MTTKETFSVLDILKDSLAQVGADLESLQKNIEEKEQQGQVVDIQNHQINTSIDQAFSNVKSILTQIKEKQGESEVTKQEILQALVGASSGREDVTRWLCDKMGIDYEKLTNNTYEKLTSQDLIQTASSPSGANNQETGVYYQVSDKEFENIREKTKKEWESLRGDFEKIVQKSTESFAEGTIPSKFLDPEFQDEALTKFYGEVDTTYIQKGYLPSYEVLGGLLTQALLKEFGFFRGMYEKGLNVFGKGTDMNIFEENLGKNIENQMLAQNLSTSLHTLEQPLKQAYKEGMYERLQKDENILDNLYGGQDPETLTFEELEHQIEYEKKQVELLESLDEYDEEEYKKEYTQGVLAGTIGVTYAVWFEKNKAPHLKGMDKTMRVLKKMARPFLKLWTIAGNFWDKLFGGKDMSWGDVFKTSKKKDNEVFQEAQKRLEKLEAMKEKKEILDYCTGVAEKINPSHTGALENLSLAQLREYQTIAERNVVFDAQKNPKEVRNTLLGKGLEKLNKPENLLLLSQWEKTGYARMNTQNDNEIMLDNNPINFTDGAIESQKAFLLKNEKLYAFWPEKMKISFQKEADDSWGAINPKEASERSFFDAFSLSQVQLTYDALKDSHVQSLFKSFHAQPEIVESLLGSGAEYFQGKSISLDFMNQVREKKVSFESVEEMTQEAMESSESPEEKKGGFFEGGWRSIRSIFSSKKENKSPDGEPDLNKKFILKSSLGVLPFDDLQEVYEWLEKK